MSKWDCLGNMCKGGEVNTISDLLYNLHFYFNFPANYVVDFMVTRGYARFWEMDYQTGTGVGGFVFSFFTWLFVFLIFLSLGEDTSKSFKEGNRDEII